ncbi:MAG: esterase-like activity of phytase family protein [Gammaproteobacteria bacterium]|nr:esterase-like activity of phytase family protein [Gammaproteobacteria bacterium]MCP5137259.1 esterase-like activity of phytase family protein [Gammaproteobacteria bacterium]
MKRVAILIALLSPLIVQAGTPIAQTTTIHPTVRDGQEFMGIRLLGTLEIAPQRIDGIALSELSGLASDPATGLLYAVSDEGSLFTFEPRFSGRTLTGLTALSATPLLDADDHPLSGTAADAEGLEWLPDSRHLLISFEREHRLAEYAVNGHYVRAVPIPSGLNPHRFTSANKGLEAVTLQDGMVLTGPEFPPQGSRADRHRIVRADGKRFTFPRLDPEGGGLTALQTLNDGRILAVERTYRSIWIPVVIRLYVFGPEPDSSVQLIAEMDNGQGWRIDNFEGLAQLPDGRLLMVSDDNDNSLQRTLLICFELVDQSPK